MHETLEIRRSARRRQILRILLARLHVNEQRSAEVESERLVAASTISRELEQKRTTVRNAARRIGTATKIIEVAVRMNIRMQMPMGRVRLSGMRGSQKAV